ncbi:hypothetical protein CEB3_c03100 [Peptococcaceae bacterium CEB3]|nr:hypothetical protein CEB3_c03100 [Peptococcaceae bacterium CEB3]
MTPNTIDNVTPTFAESNFLAQRPIPPGLQRFLAKRGITSPEQLNERMQFAPRIRWRRPR